MWLSPLVRARKLQLAVDQPLTGGLRNPPKKDPMTKDKREVTVKQYEGHNHNKIKSHTSQVGDPQNWRMIIPTKFSHCCEGSKPHIRLPSLRIRQKDREFPENLTLKVSGIWLQDFHGTGGNRDTSLGRHKQNLAHTKTQKKGTVDPTGDSTKSTC